MTSISEFIIKKLLQVFSPESHAYDNILDKDISQEQLRGGDEIISKLKVGDIIFTSTPNAMYRLARSFTGVEYDHVTVIINEQQGIHISPPSVSRISLRYLTLPSHKPRVMRLNWKEEEVHAFVSVLHSFIGEKYDYGAVIGLLKQQMRVKLSVQNHYEFDMGDLKYHQICTNIVVYCLCRARPSMQDQIREHPNSYEYRRLGAFVPDDIIRLLTNTKSTSTVYEHPDEVTQTGVSGPLARLKNIALTSNAQNMLQGFRQTLIVLRKFSANLSKRDLESYAFYYRVVMACYQVLRSGGAGPMFTVVNVVKLLIVVGQIRTIRLTIKQYVPTKYIVMAKKATDTLQVANQAYRMFKNKKISLKNKMAKVVRRSILKMPTLSPKL